MKRVVVTGMGGVTAFGETWPEIEGRLRAGRNAVQRMPQWDTYESLHTRLACPLPGFTLPSSYLRKKTRSMGPVSMYAVRASELALADAGLAEEPSIKDGRMGVAYGSSSGSVEPIRAFGAMLETGSMRDVTSNSYVQMMPHTTAVNVSLFWDLKGRIVPTSSACASGSQAIGYAYEAIASGKQALMLAGGAEELSGPAVAVFDTLYATSTRNETPALTPRPFDIDRDGLVVGEGAATLVLEEYEHALARRNDSCRNSRLRLQLRWRPYHAAHRGDDGRRDASRVARRGTGPGRHRIRECARHVDRSRRRRREPCNGVRIR